jgi:hypothetical protein
MHRPEYKRIRFESRTNRFYLALAQILARNVSLKRPRDFPGFYHINIQIRQQFRQVNETRFLSRVLRVGQIRKRNNRDSRYRTQIGFGMPEGLRIAGATSESSHHGEQPQEEKRRPK